jgi:hypothetical protein
MALSGITYTKNGLGHLASTFYDRKKRAGLAIWITSNDILATIGRLNKVLPSARSYTKL